MSPGYRNPPKSPVAKGGGMSKRGSLTISEKIVTRFNSAADLDKFRKTIISRKGRNKALVTVCSGTGNTKPLSAVKSLGDTGGWVDPGPADPAAFRYGTDAGESLNIYTSAASKGVGVEIVYYEE